MVESCTREDEGDGLPIHNDDSTFFIHFLNYDIGIVFPFLLTGVGLGLGCGSSLYGESWYATTKFGPNHPYLL